VLGLSPVSKHVWRWFERQLQQLKPLFLLLALWLRGRDCVLSQRLISVSTLIQAARVSYSGRLLFAANVF
jgi:hypothetical protein